MKITDVEVYVLKGPAEARRHWVSHFPVPNANDLLVRLRTDEGLEGFGLGSSNSAIDATAALFADGLTARLVGQDPLSPERIYESIFALTYDRIAYEKGWSRAALILASTAIDLAVWDILGKASGQPLFRLFGGYRDAVRCYVTCAYYRDGKDLAELRDEMAMLKSQGHRAFKAKVGALSIARRYATARSHSRGHWRRRQPHD